MCTEVFESTVLFVARFPNYMHGQSNGFFILILIIDKNIQTNFDAENLCRFFFKWKHDCVYVVVNNYNY